MQILFFDGRIVEAIGAGIYQIALVKDGSNVPLYIGESESILGRCSTHLYEIMKGDGYLGFSKEVLKKNIIIECKILALEPDTLKRKAEEKKYIKKCQPILQSGISDWVKTKQEMIQELKYILE